MGTTKDGLVKSRKINNFQMTSLKGRRQGARITRNEAYLTYAAVTRDEAQRSIRPFYEVVTKGTVHQWLYQYYHNGPDGLLLQGHEGRRFGLLIPDEERDLLEQVQSKAEQGNIDKSTAIA